MLLIFPDRSREEERIVGSEVDAVCVCLGLP